MLCSRLLSINEYVLNAARSSRSGLWNRTLLWPDSHMMDSDINDIPSLLMWVQQLLKCRRSWQCCSWEWFAVSEKHFCVFSCWTFHHTNKTADVVRVPFAAGSGGASESAAENPVHGSKTQLMSWKSLKLQNSSVRTEYMSLGGWRLTEVKHVKRFHVLNQGLSDLF